MLRFASYDVVFQEVPGEVTLAINLTGCPNRCKGCHSPHLQHDMGNELNESTLEELIDRYGRSVTCLCFMGGDACPQEVERLAAYVRTRTDGQLKTAWYSGRTALPPGFCTGRFDYIKLGPYIEKRGGLASPATNQRFYRVGPDGLTDVTALFYKK